MKVSPPVPPVTWSVPGPPAMVSVPAPPAMVDQIPTYDLCLWKRPKHPSIHRLVPCRDIGHHVAEGDRKLASGIAVYLRGRCKVRHVGWCLTPGDQGDQTIERIAGRARH